MRTTSVSATQASATQSAPKAPATPNAATLLDTPVSPSPDDTTDAITALFKVSSEMSAQQMQFGKVDAELAQRQRETAIAQRKEAIDRAVEAARKAREAADDGIFSNIGKNIGVMGLVGLATFNFSLVAADVAAHKTGIQDDRTGLTDLGLAVAGSPLLHLGAKALETLAPDAMNSTAFAATALGGPVGYAIERGAEKLTPDDLEKNLDQMTSVRDAEVRVANKVALMVAMTSIAATSAVLSAGASTPALIVALSGVGISAGTQIAAETGALKEAFGKNATYVALGGQIAGAALTLGASVGSAVAGVEALESVEKASLAVNVATSVTRGAASIESGVIELAVADHQHDADLANADAQGARNALARLEQMVDAILGDLQEANDASRKSTEILQETLQANNQTILMAGSMKV